MCARISKHSLREIPVKMDIDSWNFWKVFVNTFSLDSVSADYFSNCWVILSILISTLITFSDQVVATTLSVGRIMRYSHHLIEEEISFFNELSLSLLAFFVAKILWRKEWEAKILFLRNLYFKVWESCRRDMIGKNYTNFLTPSLHFPVLRSYRKNFKNTFRIDQEWKMAKIFKKN